jgi:hypothetical protein
MKLEIQLREEDLREANANAYVKKGRNEQWKIRAGVLGWIFFIILVAALWALLSRGAYRPVNVHATAEPAYDLTLAVLPSAVAAIWFLAFLSITLRVQVQVARSRAAFSKEGYERIQKSGWVGAILLIAFASLAGAQFVPAIEWYAMRFTLFLMAFVPWLVALFALALIVRVFNRAVVRNSWLGHPSLQRPYTLEMDDERLTTHSLNTDMVYRWGAFLRFRETENLYILVTEDSTFLMVPKRYLTDQAMMVEFRAILQTHIAEGYFLTVPQGAFPVVQAETLPPPLASR